MQIEQQPRGYWDGSSAATLREYVLNFGYFAQSSDKRKAALEQYQQEYKQKYFFWSAGVFGEALRAQQREAGMQPLAKQYPTIPAWLGSHPPLQAVFTPAGEILAYGELDLHIKKDEGQQMYYFGTAQGETWYRYTADGRLLGTFEPVVQRYGMNDGSWRNLYADWDWLEQQIGEQKWGSRTTLDAPGGYRIYVEIEQRKNGNDVDADGNYVGPKFKSIIGAYDWQGNMVDPDAAVDLNSKLGQSINQQMLADIYMVQVAAGLTDPQTQSPWLGTAEGPVIVDPTPRAAKVIAWGRNAKIDAAGYPRESWVEVKPLDDPANPYKNQYGAWDRWVVGQTNRHNPREQVFYNEQAEKQRAADKAAGKETSGRYVSRGMMPYIPGADDHWQTFNVRVDADGWMLPLLKWQHANFIAEPFDLRKPRDQQYNRSAGAEPAQPEYYIFEAGGVMPEEIRAQFSAALQQQRPDLLPPPVPQWLEEKLRSREVTSVIFVPGGEFVTREPLPGEVEEPTADAVSGTVQLKVPKSVWHRYSADGELLGIAPDSAPWQQLYNPQLDSLLLSAKSQGLAPDMSSRYLIWRKATPNGMGGEAIAAWDYDGSPLSLEQPLLDDRSFFRYWDAANLLKANMGVLDLRY